MLTREEELFVATRLLSRARHSSKKLKNAHGKTLHPVLLKQIHDDVAECTRLALKLQGAQMVEEPVTVRCGHCVNGRFVAECCNGASGCSCEGREVDMGPCRVCHGTGWREQDADTTANIRAIEGRCYLGSGPR